MLDFSSLPMGATLLAPAHLHPLIRQKLLQTTHGLLGLRLYTLNGYLSAQSLEDAPSEASILFAYRERIKQLSSSLHIYQEAALTSVFLKECMQCLDDLKIWQIPLSVLSEQEEAHAERKTILTALYPIETQGDLIVKAIREIAHKDAHMVYIYDAFFTPQQQQLVNLLVRQGATLLQDEEIPYERKFYHAVNKRQEIEGCAQYILRHEMKAEDVAITLADTSYIPILEQIFNRYHIPYTNLVASAASSIIVKRARMLLNYYLQPTQEHLLACLDCGIFHEETLSSLLQYLQIYQKDFFQPFNHLQTLSTTSHILNETDVAKLKEIEERAEIARRHIAEQLRSLMHPASYEEMLLTVLNLLKNSLSNDMQQSAVLQDVMNVINEVYPYIKEKDDITFLLQLLEDITVHSTVHQLQGVSVTSLKQGSCTRKHHFLLGATQNQYPAFMAKRGIFDEHYYETLPFPSMEHRYQLHLKQLRKLLNRSQHLYISYPLGTYEGKSLEAALEIEQMFDERAKPYPLQEMYEKADIALTITSQTAHELFVRNQQIKGSISSIERYVKCPFSYFLRYGLGIREPMKLGFADSYMGTLSHYLLETLTKQQGKAYTSVCETTLTALIDKEIDALQEVFSDMRTRLQILRIRIESSIMQTLRRLASFEEHSHFQPWQQEREFQYEIPVTSDVTLALHGFIDRLDVYDDILCILDYKSSAKTLSETKVFAAMQLQLLTYSIVMAKLEQKEIMGAYYLSLKNENIPHPAGKLSRRKPVTYTPIEKADLQDVIIKTHRIHGWTMYPNVSLLDDEGTHVSGVRCNKDQLIKASKLYDLHSIERWFTSIYQQLAKRMLDGDIVIEPSEDACLYCDFHAICRFHGMPFERKAMVETDDSLYRKGEDEDA